MAVVGIGICALAVAIAAAVLLGVAGRDVTDSVGAIFTAVGGVAAAAAAWASLKTARETQKALALHYRPATNATSVRVPQVDDSGVVTVTGPTFARPEDVRSVEMHWIDAKGNSHSRTFGAQPIAFVLEGVHAVPSSNHWGGFLLDGRELRVVVFDRLTGTRWEGSVRPLDRWIEVGYVQLRAPWES